ncbi:hypothetical protein GCK32_018485, partial [Trichostrongylus colubriformis]
TSHETFPFRVKRLRKSSSYRLLLFLTMTDFLHGVTTLPYTIYLTVNWDPIYIDMDPYFVLILGTPLVAQLKINLMLTIAIAFERVMALLCPMAYRKMPSSKYATICLLIGCILGTVDIVLEFVLTPFDRSPECGAFGCFIDRQFRHYWGISNMVLGFVVIILITIIIAKLRFMHKESQKENNNQHTANKFSQVLSILKC